MSDLHLPGLCANTTMILPNNPISVAFCCRDKHCAQKECGGRNDLFGLDLHNAKAGIQGKNPGTGTEAQATEERCLLSCSPQLVQSAFLNNPTPCSRVVLPTVR